VRPGSRGVRNLVGEIGRLVLVYEELLERGAIQADRSQLHLAVLGLDHTPSPAKRRRRPLRAGSGLWLPIPGGPGSGSTVPSSRGSRRRLDDVHGEDVHELSRVGGPATDHDVPARFGMGMTLP
jgi:hypothetical protein